MHKFFIGVHHLGGELTGKYGVAIAVDVYGETTLKPKDNPDQEKMLALIEAYALELYDPSDPVKRVQWRAMGPYEHNPTFISIEQDDVQNLVDQLWILGFRPKQIVRVANEYLLPKLPESLPPESSEAQ